MSNYISDVFNMYFKQSAMDTKVEIYADADFYTEDMGTESVHNITFVDDVRIQVSIGDRTIYNEREATDYVLSMLDKRRYSNRAKQEAARQEIALTIEEMAKANLQDRHCYDSE